MSDEATQTIIGRDAELDAARRALEQHGWLALHGPPGTGKTRLARELVDRWKSGAEHGVAFVELDRATSIADVRRRIAASIGLGWAENAEHLVFAELLSRAVDVIVLDRVERAAGALAEHVPRWLEDAPELRVVTTSRLRLDTPGELVVRPLETADAVALFIRHARRAQRDFEPDDTGVIADLVEMLDRLPLAIELAARRVSVLSPAAILDRLDDRFRLLRERNGRTMRAAIGWSWELLDDPLRDVLHQCTVFGGSFAVADVEAVVESDDPFVVDLLQEAVDHSLLQSTTVHGETRFSLFRSVREFVWDAEGDVDEALVGRHATWVISEAERRLDAMDTAGAETTIARFEPLAAELALVFERHARSEVDRAARAALALDRFFGRSATDAVRAHYLQRAIEFEGLDPKLAARLHLARGHCAVDSGDLNDAIASFRKAIEVARLVDDRGLEARATFRIGDVERRRGSVADAQMLIAQAQETAGDESQRRLMTAHLACCHADLQQLGRARSRLEDVAAAGPGDSLIEQSEVSRRLAYVHFYLGNHEEQHRLGLRALDQARRAQHRRREALCIQGVGQSALLVGESDVAEQHFLEAVEMHRQLGDVHYEAVLLGNLGALWHQRNAIEEAADAYREALRLHRRTGAQPYEAVVRFGLGVLESERGRLEESDHHLNHAVRLGDQLGLHDDVGAARMVMGWNEFRRGAPERAAESLRAAEADFERAETESWRALASVGRELGEALVAKTRWEVAEAKRLVADTGGTHEKDVVAGIVRLASALGATQDDDDGRDLDRTSLHVRAVLAAAEDVGGREVPATSSDGPVAADTPGVLKIEAGARSFQVGEEPAVDLRRRRSIRLMLAELARLRVEEPGTGIDVYEAFEVGWPGEKATAQAAADRVYWAVRTLRRLGLDDILLTSDEGYYLDPDRTVLYDGK